MNYDPHKHKRRSIRLKGYDYSQPGAYFITICTYQRECLLGEIHRGEMLINELGQFVIRVWKDLPGHYPHVILDAFCVMPNHIHGIIIFSDTCGRGEYEIRPSNNLPPHKKRHGLPEIVRALKSFSARLINQRRDTQGVPVWQRNYYEHIVRNELELNTIRQYVNDNPLKWGMDLDNPSNINKSSLYGYG